MSEKESKQTSIILEGGGLEKHMHIQFPYYVAIVRRPPTKTMQGLATASYQNQVLSLDLTWGGSFTVLSVEGPLDEEQLPVEETPEDETPPVEPPEESPPKSGGIASVLNRNKK